MVPEQGLPPLEMIGDLLYAPGSDIPFGKAICIGLKECLIYDSAIEKGYEMGIAAHLMFLDDHQMTAPIMLDDRQFTMMIKGSIPQGLSAYEKGLWSSFFIVGWTCVYLGIIVAGEELKEEHGS